MKISYNWLQSFFKKKLPAPEKLADLLTRHSFETELVKKVGQDYLLDVEVLPNRAHDCLSHLGITREIGALLKTVPLSVSFQGLSPLVRPLARTHSQGQSLKNFVKVEIKDKNLCPRYTARALINVKVGASPKWLQERIEVCGLRPISNIVDIANYVMLETGQPLHAFDADKLKSKGETKTIIVRRAKKGEKITTLDNEKYDLDENILVIADEKNPVCVAGIKGGQGPGIDGQTKSIILEAANFSSQIVRQGSQQLNLKTDASWRFEHQLDPNLTEEAVDMAAYLVQKIAGGEILDGIVDVYPVKIKPKKVKLDIKRVKSLLGVDIPIREIKSILERLGFGIRMAGNSFQATIPTRRLDVAIPEDLIEEIGRLYGFEKIPSQLPSATLIPPERNEGLIYQNKVRDILTNLGFNEVYNYSFISEKDISDFKLKNSKLIELLNPVSQEQKYLRSELAVNLLKNVRENKKYFEEVRLFEIGKTFFKDSSGKDIKERKRLAGVISLANKSKQTQEFYRLKGVIDSLLNKLRISDQWYDDQLTAHSPVPDFCHPNRRAEIKVGDDIIGWLGEIDEKTLRRIDIRSRVAVFKLDFEKIVELATEERIYAAPSKYPAVVRDVALLVERGTKVVKVLNLINAAGGCLVRDVDLFDMYEGEEIPQGKKNLAFHIIYQSDDHTLTDKEVNQIQDKIIKALKKEGGWEVRR